MAWWIALLGVTFFAAAAQSATGFGFGLIAVPVFLVLLDSIAAVQLVAIVTLVMSGALWLTIRQQASGQFLKWLLIGCALGFPLGILASSRLDIDAIKTSVAVLIIVFSSYNGWLIQHAKAARWQRTAALRERHRCGYGVGSDGKQHGIARSGRHAVFIGDCTKKR